MWVREVVSFVISGPPANVGAVAHSPSIHLLDSRHPILGWSSDEG